MVDRAKAKSQLKELLHAVAEREVAVEAAAANLLSDAYEHVPPPVRRIFGVVEFDSPVVITLVFACTLIHAVAWLTSGASTKDWFSCHPFRWTQLFVFARGTSPPIVWWRLFSHVLGHSSWQHLSGNVSLILLVGPPCEKDYGGRMLVLILLWTASTTGLLHNALGPGNTILMGASGIAFALILLNSLLNVHDRKLPVTFLLTCALWLSSGASCQPRRGTARMVAATDLARCLAAVAAVAAAAAGAWWCVVRVPPVVCVCALAELGGFVSNLWAGKTGGDGVSHLAHLFGAVVGAACGFVLHHPEAKRGVLHALRTRMRFGKPTSALRQKLS
jgi:rhomboid protease GluP